MKDAIQKIRVKRTLLLTAYIVIIVCYIGALLSALYSLRLAVLLVGLVTVAFFTGSEWLRKQYENTFSREKLKVCVSGYVHDVQSLRRNSEGKQLKEQAFFPAEQAASGIGISGECRTGEVKIYEVLSYYPSTVKNKMAFEGTAVEKASKNVVCDYILISTSFLPVEEIRRFYLNHGWIEDAAGSGSNGYLAWYRGEKEEQILEKQRKAMLRTCREMKGVLCLAASAGKTWCLLPDKITVDHIPIRESLNEKIIGCHAYGNLDKALTV